MALIPEADRRHLASLHYAARQRANSTSSTTSSTASRESSETRMRKQRQLRKQSSPAYLSADYTPATTKSCTPSPVRSSASSDYHHHRSQSVKIAGKNRQRARSKSTQLDVEAFRPRGATTGGDHHRIHEDSQLYRLRNFAVTAKGDVVNKGDSYRTKSFASLTSPTRDSYMDFPRNERLSVSSAYSTAEASSSGDTNSSQNPRYKVLMLGGSSVGKSALTNQFLTSEFMNAYENSLTDEESEPRTVEKSVSVLLDGVESELDIIDPDSSSFLLDERQWESNPMDAYVIVYSVADRPSFEKAIDILFELKQSEVTKHQAIILVGNKSDLVRARIVSKDEGKSIASQYDCKFTETSAGLNHNVDELLVGILTQIRLKEKQAAKKSKSRNFRKYKGRSREKRSLTSGYEKAFGLLSKLLSHNSLSKSCGNLHVL